MTENHPNGVFPVSQEQVSALMSASETFTDFSDISVNDKGESMNTDIDPVHGSIDEDPGDLGCSEDNKDLVGQAQDKVVFLGFQKKSKPSKKGRKKAKEQQSLVDVEIPGEEFAKGETSP